jgi:hypothetical protein
VILGAYRALSLKFVAPYGNDFARLLVASGNHQRRFAVRERLEGCCSTAPSRNSTPSVIESGFVEENFDDVSIAWKRGSWLTQMESSQDIYSDYEQRTNKRSMWLFTESVDNQRKGQMLIRARARANLDNISMRIMARSSRSEPPTSDMGREDVDRTTGHKIEYRRKKTGSLPVSPGGEGFSKGVTRAFISV